MEEAADGGGIDAVPVVVEAGLGDPFAAAVEEAVAELGCGGRAPCVVF